MAVDTAIGLTVTFGTTSYTANIVSARWTGISRGAVDTTHLGTTTAKSYTPFDLFDPGELEMGIQFDIDDYPPIDQAAETITVTAPIASGESAGGTWAATGFVTGFEWGGSTEENLMDATVTVKFSGDITDTDGS